MNEFERAIERTEKREQRKTLHLPTAVELAPDIAPVAKEKSTSIDGIIKVTVTLPYETFEMSFTKATLSEGLKPLLGNLR
jgi:hypothetical protein